MVQSRQLAAVMFTDIVGYTAIMGRDEDEALVILEKNRQIQKPLIEKYNGQLLKELGDGTMAQFHSAYDAVLCAIEIQQQARDSLHASLRVGIHLGDITNEENDVFGDGVNLASRIQSIADPGGIYISESIEKAIRNRIDIQTKYLGEAVLKNVDYPVKVFAVTGNGLPAPHFIAPKVKQRKRRLAVYAMLLVAMIAAGWFITESLLSTSTQTIRSLAVLPITNMTGSDENLFIAQGLHDALITQLSHINSLRVISRHTVNQYANTKKSAAEIADELNVDALVESSLLRVDDSIQLNVQLVKLAPEETHLWAGIFAQSLSQVLGMISHVTTEISTNISAVLTKEEKELITDHKEVDPELYKMYVRGKLFLEQYTPEGFQNGLQYLNEVVKKDPAYAPAYATLAIGYGDLAHLPSAPKDAFPRAQALAKRALELDSTLTEANTAMAEAHLYHTWQFKNAETYFKAALSIDSSYTPALSNYGWYLDLAGNNDAAEYYLRKAADLDPLAPIYRTWLAWWYWTKERYEEGIAEIDKVFVFAPGFPVAEMVLGGIYTDMGKFEEGIQHAKQAADAFPNLAFGLGMAYAKAGKTTEAYAVVDQLEKTAFNAFSLMLIYTELGEKDKAWEWAKVVYEIRHVFTPWVMPSIEKKGNDPRVRSLFKPIADSVSNIQNT